jgi:Zn-dependent peptidase ImmA (M78 family)
MAHELGHILLCERFGWNPDNGRDYYRCEDWCDLFAAHLLLPQQALARLEFDAANKALISVGRLAAECKVSLEVAARRVVPQVDGLAFFQGKEKTNAKCERVMELDWGTSSIPELHLNRHLHLKEDHPLGGALLTRSRGHWTQEFRVPGIGLGCGRSRRGKWLFSCKGSAGEAPGFQK